jgi:hypothetical protein
LEIPGDICKELKDPTGKISDIPHLIVTIRNNIAHPKQYGDIEIEPYRVWNLAQWYIELMLLRLCRYEGKYHNRGAIQKYRTAPDFVPWATKEKSEPK